MVSIGFHLLFPFNCQPTQSLTESYVTAWLDAADRLTALGTVGFRRAIERGVDALRSVNENDDPWTVG